MKYGILPVRHSNARYQAELSTLAEKELLLLLKAGGLTPNAQWMTISGVELITFEADALTAEQADILSDHSLLYWLFEIRSDNSLMPVLSQKQALLGEDLPYIQKYKGKTNERFTQMLINMALYSSSCFREEGLKMLDPMCGRGTSLFLAANRGVTPTGADASRSEIAECSRFFKRYLEYHRIKHKQNKHARTHKGVNIPMETFDFAMPFGENGSRGEIALATVDARNVHGLGKGAYHILVADLPYGVQHAPSGKGGLAALMEETAEAYRAALKPGGAAALAFNVNTLKRIQVTEALEKAGFEIAEGEIYDGMAHWVEQAVTRDVVVGIVPEKHR
ncbi:MAG: hypothetical protein E7335_02530 [Clostridiales bacterium]|nr:hypothetical protein [Clostridiales bacterium]